LQYYASRAASASSSEQISYKALTGLIPMQIIPIKGGPRLRPSAPWQLEAIRQVVLPWEGLEIE